MPSKTQTPSLRLLGLLAAAAAAHVVAACGGSDTNEDYPVPFWQVDGGNQSEDSGSVSPEIQYFAAWALRRQETQDPSPFSNAWAESRTSALSLVRVVWLENVGTRWEQTCALHSNAAHGTPVTYPPALVKAIPVEPVPLWREPGKIHQPEFTSWLGLSSGYEGLMPALGERQHPAVLDADADGQPGVTVHIDIPVFGDEAIYVASRTTSHWTGVVSSDGTVTATASSVREQRVVGATLSLLIADEVARPVPDKPPEELRWVPATAELDCASLASNSASILGVVWPP